MSLWRHEKVTKLTGGDDAIVAAEISKYSLEYVTWPEAEKILQKSRVVMVPIGAATKEHGYHLPLNNDYILAEYLANEVSKRTSIYRFPTVPYGYYPSFVEYPGSVNISKETFSSMLCDIARSIQSHGTMKIYFLNTGISTNWALEPARQQLEAEGIVMEYTDLTSIVSDIEASIAKQTRGTHADEIETSMMLHIAPEIVRMKLAKKDDNERRQTGKLTRDPNVNVGIYSATGAWGDPTLATKEKGQTVVEALVQRISAFLKDFANENYRIENPRNKYLG